MMSLEETEVDWEVTETRDGSKAVWSGVGVALLPAEERVELVTVVVVEIPS